MQSPVTQRSVAPVLKTDVKVTHGPRGPRAVRRGILRVYGWTGVLMVAAFLLSGVWTLALAVVQLAPSAVANYLMDTAEFDFGDFWTLQKADDTLAISAAVMLVAFALGYFVLVAEMIRLSLSCGLTCLRSRAVEVAEVHPRDGPSCQQVAGVPTASSENATEQLDAPTSRDCPSSLGQRYRLWWWLGSRVGQVVKSQDTPASALPKLLLQTTILFKYLREGFPPTTIFFYSSLLVLNWMISMYCAAVQLANPRAALVRVFYSFDLFFAVFAPLQVIFYASKHFAFDRAEFETRIQVLNPGNFDVVARLFADPAQVSLFRAAFCSLQLSSLSSLAVKAALNVFTIRKWWRTIRSLGEAGRSRSVVETQQKRLSRGDRTLAPLFFIIGVTVFVYSVVAVVSSTNVCERFVHCKVPSYRWNVGAQQCSCSVFVDRHTQVKTFDEWEDPIDTTSNLAELAASGDLKVIQIINRQLPTLPDELRRCRGLQQLILIYSKTITIPDWTREFTQLEYLHIEGDLTAKQLQLLPRDLFADTPKLAFLHLGSLPLIPFIPDLDRVPHLKYLTLAMLYTVTALPSFDNLVNLESMLVVDPMRVETFPSVARLHKLKSLMVTGRTPFCCNGFWNGDCNLASYSCRDRTSRGQPRVQCTPERMTTIDRGVIEVAGHHMCDEIELLSDLSDARVTRNSSDGACSGLKYKLCELHGVPGICFPSRMMAIACETFPLYADLRRLQIERGVGEPCDPVTEQWLGCRPR